MAITPTSPKTIKGAFVELSHRFISVVPNVIVFQYNPEKMTRKLEPWYGGGDEGKKTGPEGAKAQPHDPPESFDLELELDAADLLEKPELHPVAFISGVSDRLAALEMLLYPEQKTTALGLLGSATAALGGAAGGALGGATGSVLAGAALGGAAALGAGFIEKGLTKTLPVPNDTVPTVLFCWGPGRVVPVRITSLSVEEEAYSPTLYPIRAKVKVGVKIMAPRHYPCSENQDAKIAIAAYNLYIRQKRGFAASNVANTVEGMLGMIPF